MSGIMRLDLGQGFETIIDAEDYLRVRPYKWRAVNNNGTGMWYARTRIYFDNKDVSVFLHRMVMNVYRSKTQLDHVNRDSLDNRKTNLRVCSTSENQCNRVEARNNKSGFKGVFFHEGKNRWVAQLQAKGHTRFVAYFDDKISAALAYNEAARLYHGEFACLNEVG